MKKWLSIFAGLLLILLVFNYRTVAYVANNASTSDLYQQYYDLQLQRDAAGDCYDERRTKAWCDRRRVEQELREDSTNTELHRQLIRVQNDWEQAQVVWLAAINPIDGKLNAIRNVLGLRGEPPPGF